MSGCIECSGPWISGYPRSPELASGDPSRAPGDARLSGTSWPRTMGEVRSTVGRPIWPSAERSGVGSAARDGVRQGWEGAVSFAGVARRARRKRRRVSGRRGRRREGRARRSAKAPGQSAESCCAEAGRRDSRAAWPARGARSERVLIGETHYAQRCDGPLRVPVRRSVRRVRAGSERAGVQGTSSAVAGSAPRLNSRGARAGRDARVFGASATRRRHSAPRWWPYGGGVVSSGAASHRSCSAWSSLVAVPRRRSPLRGHGRRYQEFTRSLVPVLVPPRVRTPATVRVARWRGRLRYPPRGQKR